MFFEYVRFVIPFLQIMYSCQVVNITLFCESVKLEDHALREAFSE